MISSFMLKILSIDHLIERGRHWHKQICFIQFQIRARLRAKLAKEYMMDAAWDKLIGKLMYKATDLHDQATKEMLTKILQVPHEVKEAVCKYYIDKCLQLGAIAFLQWRLAYPSEVNFDQHAL